MTSVSLKCPSADCKSTITTSCKSIDQLLVCAACKAVFTFVNMGVIECQTCKDKISIKLNTRFPGGMCTKCRVETSLGQKGSGFEPVGAYRFENDDYVGYCGRQMFAGFEEQVTIATNAFKKIDRINGGWLFKKTKPSMFVNLIDLHPKETSVERVRGVHCYCNFKWHSTHENAKFVGFPYGFADGVIMNRAVNEKGLVDFWFGDESILNDFRRMPKLSALAGRFKLLA